jgi:uncharacterized protein YdeI (YjbR/CyaY-like superfamily)
VIEPSASPRFFESPAEFEGWLDANHVDADELLVGFRKKHTKLPSLTWPESVEVALCFGWIDGIRRSIDSDSYSIRFTPRRKGSIWSAVNIRIAQRLIEEGRMRPAGLAAFELRDEERAYSFARGSVALAPEIEAMFRSDAVAWEFFQAQPASYRSPMSWWVISAKRSETRLKRLGILMAASAHARLLDPLRPGALVPPA